MLGAQLPSTLFSLSACYCLSATAGRPATAAPPLPTPSPQALHGTLTPPTHTNGLQVLHGHPDAGGIWTEDLLVRGFNEDMLRQMLETVGENVSYGFSVVEVGAKDTKFTSMVSEGQGEGEGEGLVPGSRVEGISASRCCFP